MHRPFAADTVRFCFFVGGARFHHKFDGGWARPGLAVAQGLDGPTEKHTVVRIDLPFVF